MHPIEARQLSRGVGQLQQMLDDATDLAAHCVALALTQIFDLLGDVLAIEPVVGDAQRAQHLGLVLGPGVKIVFVAWSIRHYRCLHFSSVSCRGRPQLTAAATVRSMSSSSINPSSTSWRAAAAIAVAYAWAFGYRSRIDFRGSPVIRRSSGLSGSGM